MFYRDHDYLLFFNEFYDLLGKEAFKIEQFS